MTNHAQKQKDLLNEIPNILYVAVGAYNGIRKYNRKLPNSRILSNSIALNIA